MTLQVHDGRTKKERQDLFLESYPEFGTISGAARVAHISTTSVYRWLKDEVGFATRFSGARKEFVDYLEDIAHALVKEMGCKKDYRNPTLLMFLLNGNAPEKYKGVTDNNSEARDVLIEFRKITRQAVVTDNKAKIEEHTAAENTIIAYEKEKKALNEKFGSLKNDNTDG